MNYFETISHLVFKNRGAVTLVKLLYTNFFSMLKQFEFRIKVQSSDNYKFRENESLPFSCTPEQLAMWTL